MQTRNSYCFEYLVTKAKMPRQRTCCPFMQRTLYRVARNLARLDLGFSCPDLEGSSSPTSTATPTPTMKRKASPRKQRHHGRERRLEEIRPSSGGVLNWLVRGTLSRRDPSDTLSSAPPMPRSDIDNETLNEQGDPALLEMEEETTNGEAADHLLLKQKRKLLRRQKIYDMDSSMDVTTSGRVSSTSQVGQNSMDQAYAPPSQAPQATKHHAPAPLRITPEIDDWEREVKGEAGRSHDQIDPSIPLPVSTTTATANTVSTSIAPTVIPPFSVREPVEKQVRSWLESTSDEYDILLKRSVLYPLNFAFRIWS
ncbi:unnamed protein product [Hydatigera taeniaeformis]|uniref:Uncharacterized protein n=1 Tax=Hydatigena taeniaeformis TaxID=6205 RepID=A0A0R3WK50_HYDTA|nr:unnamed protein product [Hydatigera taeniaeformis]